MEEEKFSFADTFLKAREYVDTQIELLKMRALARGSRILGSVVLDLAKILLVLFVLFFCSLALGFFLGELLGSNAFGFLLTGVLFFAVLAAVRSFEPKLEARFTDWVVRKVAEKWDEEEDAAKATNINTGESEGFEENK